MTSNRRRKQKAQSMGLTEAELQLTELLGQVLGYSNQYLLHEKLGLSAEERHRVMKAAAGAVEADGRTQDWGKRLMEIQESLQAVHERMTGERLERAAGGHEGQDAAGPRGEDDAGAAEAAGG